MLKTKLFTLGLKLSNLPSKVYQRLTGKDEQGRKVDKGLFGGDKLSIFFTVSTIAIVGALGYYAYNQTKQANYEASITPYYDENLNFSLDIPKEWTINEGNKSAIKTQVLNDSSGMNFDLSKYPLSKEVVPLALIKKPEDKNAKVLDKYMTIAFKPTKEQDFTELDDKLQILDDFKSMLVKLKHTDVKVTSVKENRTGEMNGVLARATGLLKNTPMVYYQYFEPAGRNILVITYGSSHPDADHIGDINKILKNLHYYNASGLNPDGIGTEGEDTNSNQSSNSNSNSDSNNNSNVNSNF